jgi:peptide-methionine (S)-S-oxide reductase
MSSVFENSNNRKVLGLGGGCHWCTEAVFKSLNGISNVRQGWIKSKFPHDTYSEAVVLEFDKSIIPAQVLLEIHLRTHSSTSQHKLRSKNRSAVYFFETNETDFEFKTLQKFIERHQDQFKNPAISMVLRLVDFKLNESKYLDYYKKNRNNQFCKRYIDPKLAKLQSEFSSLMSSK